MIKIKLKQSNMLTEVSARYLMDAFKVPQEFAEMVNQNYRQNGDALVEVFIGQLGRKVVEKPFEELNKDFQHFMSAPPSKVGEMLDIVLKKYPAKKKELVELPNENYHKFLKTLRALECKSLLPKEVFRIAKEQYRDNQDELIEIYCLWSTRTGRVRITPEQLGERFVRLMNNDGRTYDEVFKKFPAQKKALVDAAYTSFDTFEDRVYALKRQGEQTPVESIIDFPDGFEWFDLKTEYCSKEAVQMGHCGAAAYGGTIYSLRKGEDEDEKSFVTIEYKKDSNQIFQIKGPQNTFPQEKYWPYIYKFIEHFGVAEDDIEEPMATNNYDFMKGLSKEEEGGFENDLAKLKQLAESASAAEGTEGLDSLSKIRKILKRVFKEGLSAEQAVQVYSASYIKTDNVDGNLETFSFGYPKEESLEYDLEVADGILEYNKQNGLFKTPNDVRALSKFLISGVQILHKIREKDERELKGLSPTKYFINLPIIKKIESMMDDVEGKEIKESRKRLPLKYKADHRGYFRYDQNKIRKQESP